MLEIIIKTEDDAWYWLQKAKNGQIDRTEPCSLRFEGWPEFRMRYTGKDFHQSVPTRVMPSLLTAQNEINKAYALVRYGSANPKKLTKKDRDVVELNVKVDEGSSWYEINLQEVLNEFARAAALDMNSTDLIIIAIVAGLAYATPTMWKHWLEHKSRERESDNSVKLSQVERDKMQIIADIKTHTPQVQIIQDGADYYKNESLRKLKAEDGFNLPDEEFTVTGTMAEQITTTPREESSEVRIDGEFSILGVDSGEVDGFKLHVKRLLDGKKFRVKAEDSVITDEVSAALQKSEWQKRRVILEINARILRGEITAAHLLSARLPK